MKVYAGTNINDPNLNPPTITSPGQLISVLLPNVYLVAGIILFILLMAGGFGIIINSGKGMKEGVVKGNKLISAALLGFVVIIGSYWIIQIIRAVTGVNILEPGM